MTIIPNLYIVIFSKLSLSDSEYDEFSNLNAAIDTINQPDGADDLFVSLAPPTGYVKPGPPSLPPLIPQ